MYYIGTHIHMCIYMVKQRNGMTRLQQQKAVHSITANH